MATGFPLLVTTISCSRGNVAQIEADLLLMSLTVRNFMLRTLFAPSSCLNIVHECGTESPPAARLDLRIPDYIFNAM